MKTLILLLLSTIMYSQTYVGLNGGIQELTDTKPGISAYVQQNFDNFGTSVYYMYREDRVKDIDAFGLDFKYNFLANNFYEPEVFIGTDVSDRFRFTYGITNYFRIQHNYKFELTYRQIENISYTSFGINILFDLIQDKNFKPRFF